MCVCVLWRRGGEGATGPECQKTRETQFVLRRSFSYLRERQLLGDNKSGASGFFCAECVVVGRGGLLESCQKKAEEGDFMFVVNKDVTSAFPRTS